MIRNDLYATLEKKVIPIKFDESRKIPGANPVVKSLPINQKSNLDRNSILERLKMNNVLVTSCKIPDKKEDPTKTEVVEEDVEEQEQEQEQEKKEVIVLEEEEEGEEQEQVQVQVQEQEVQEQEMPGEDPDNMEIEKTESKSVFVICANTKVAPGSAAQEKVMKPDNFKELGKQDDWRSKLCNSYPLESFEIEGKKWANVHHYLIYAKYKSQNEELKQAIINSYETAVSAEKTGTMKGINEKGKLGKIVLTIDPDYERDKSKLIYHALYVRFYI